MFICPACNSRIAFNDIKETGAEARLLASTWVASVAAQNNVLQANLTATQNRCTELLNENRLLKSKLRGVVDHLDKANAAKHLDGEGDCG